MARNFSGLQLDRAERQKALLVPTTGQRNVQGPTNGHRTRRPAELAQRLRAARVVKLEQVVRCDAGVHPGHLDRAEQLVVVDVLEGPVVRVLRHQLPDQAGLVGLDRRVVQLLLENCFRLRLDFSNWVVSPPWGRQLVSSGE